MDRITFEVLRQHREAISRQLFLDVVFGFIADCKIDGDYFEFGGGSGGSLIAAFSAAKRYSRLGTMQFFVFDSFSGLPEPTGLDADQWQRYHAGDYACTADVFKGNILKAGLDLDRIKIVEGWYSDTLTPQLTANLQTRAAVIHIDCDLYTSTTSALEFLVDYIQDGTVIVFDDWFSYRGRLDRGEARAFAEWLEKYPSITATEYHKVDRTITSFILHRS